MRINFSDIPGQTNLFLDFLYEFENVSDYYEFNINDGNSLQNSFEEILNRYSGHNDLIHDIISDQYLNFNKSKLTERNIKLLSEPNTLTVTTGQQVSLLTGPLYTIYKAISAVKLADYLRSKYDNYNFVPIFWLAGDDHDFEEVRYFNIINSENKIQKIIYDDNLEPETNRGSVGAIKFTDDIRRVISEFKSAVRSTEFTDSIFELIESAYKPGNNFASAFREIMFQLFDDYGLIIFDPQDIRVKELLKPVFIQELENYEQHVDPLVELSAELDEVYHAQVKVKPVNLFMHIDKGRYSIEPDGNHFKLKGKRKKYTREELVELANNSPELFSPNVLLRPVCQDYIFPNTFYIGGPGEISYYAQLKPLYDFYEMPAPMVYPRCSATLIDNTLKKIISKFELSPLDFFLEEKLLNEKVVNKLNPVNINELFANSSEKIKNVYSEILAGTKQIDNSVQNAVNKNLERTLDNMNFLRNKIENLLTQKHENSLRQIQKARTVIFPNNNLQERELNIFYFLNKYGFDLIKQLFVQFNVTKFEHEIIEI